MSENEKDIQEKVIKDTIERTVSFSSDNYQLRGILHLPLKAEKPPVVIGSHGLFSGKDSPKQIALAEKCNAEGIAYFRFDHRGCGDSEGNFKEVTGFEARCNDLISAIRTTREQDDLGDRIALFGSSLGGAVCLNVCRQMGISALVTLAAPLKSEPVFRAMQKAGEETELEGFHPAALQFDLSKKVAEIKHILVFHGDSDKTVPPSDAHRLYQKCVLPKRIIMLRNGDHRLSSEENQKKFYLESVAWFRKWLLDNRQ